VATKIFFQEGPFDVKKAAAVIKYWFFFAMGRARWLGPAMTPTPHVRLHFVKRSAPSLPISEIEEDEDQNVATSAPTRLATNHASAATAASLAADPSSRYEAFRPVSAPARQRILGYSPTSCMHGAELRLPIQARRHGTPHEWAHEEREARTIRHVSV
jgi:hypothetical protein